MSTALDPSLYAIGPALYPSCLTAVYAFFRMIFLPFLMKYENTQKQFKLFIYFLFWVTIDPYLRLLL